MFFCKPGSQNPADSLHIKASTAPNHKGARGRDNLLRQSQDGAYYTKMPLARARGEDLEFTHFFESESAFRLDKQKGTMHFSKWNGRSPPDKKELRALGLSLPLRSFAESQRRFRTLNCLLGLPSAGFEGMATSPLLRRGGLEDTSSSSKTTCIVQRGMNERREANAILRSGSESHADRS